MRSRTTVAGIAAGALIGLLPFLGSEPLSWQRAAVFIAVAVSVGAIGVFARDAPSPKAEPPTTPDP